MYNAAQRSGEKGRGRLATTDEETLKAQIKRGRGNFLAMAASYSLGVFNDNFFRQAAMLMAVAAGSKWLQGAALAIFSVPYLLFAAPAGWLADRYPKRSVVIWAKGLELVAMLCGAAGVLTGMWSLILAMVFLMGLQSCLFSPSLNGSIPELYPDSYVTTANAGLKVATTSAILLGTALAGVALNRKALLRPGLSELTQGQGIVAIAVVAVSLVGLLVSFGVPRRRAADPGVRFPWTGPADTVRELRRILKDRMLAVAAGGSAFVFFVGGLQFQIINELGMKQFGLGEMVTSCLIFSELAGIAAGGIIGARLAKGRWWYRVLTPSALLIALPALGVVFVPSLPPGWGWYVLPAVLACTGLLAGAILIPCEAFIQIRPAPERKGAVIAAANFAVFAGIILSAPLGWLALTWFAPTTCFALVAGVALFAGLVFAMALPAGPGNLLDIALVWFANRLLRLRYRIEIIGLDEIAQRGTEGILFLPNHPALIDPVIMSGVLHSRFAPHAWADADQVDRPVIRALARRIGVRAVPGVKRGDDSRKIVRQALETSIQDLKERGCVLLYPSGHVYRHYLENVRGNSAAHTMLQNVPGCRGVLVRTHGLWGSGLSWAGGHVPSIARTLKKGIPGLLLSGILFAPKRRVTIEFREPDDLPRDADRDTLNRFLQAFYNEDAPPNTYVPFSIWEKGGVRRMPEPFIGALAGDVDLVPKATREIVEAKLRELAGIAEIRDEQHLARDLGLDSLARAELVVWVEGEFGFPAGDHESVQTVSDVLLAACGESVQGEPEALKPIAARWFKGIGAGGRLPPPEGETVTEAFLNAAARRPGAVAIADQTSGVKTYRDLITAILVLKPEIEKLPGECVGVMMPASVGANILYLSALFAGKTPVMVNWTVGPRNAVHCLDLVGVRHILTARALISRIASQGTDLGELGDRFVFLEDIRPSITLRRKLGAWLRARLSRRSLRRADVPETAVILFTSGSESLPKAVPLTHGNLLVNCRDVCAHVALRRGERLIGILPPFHSFGLTVTMVLPLCTGMPAVYHPNPTEAGMLARLIEAYRVSLLMGTPTFLNGIVRASTTEQLSTLRLAVTGAEKCPDRVYEALAERCPHTVVLEGYGVTECSPIVSANTEDARPGTIGKMLQSVEHAVVDVDTGERRGAGERGMLLVRGPSVFGGYLNYDGSSPFVEFEGKQWYRTGDLVTEDEDGVLTFRGRLKRFTKLGGEMISLPAIESVLQLHYGSEDDDGPSVAVEVTPNEEHPEIVLFTTTDADRETANRLIRDAGLSALHNVRRVIRIDEIPLLGTGKADYRSLRERLRAESGDE